MSPVEEAGKNIVDEVDETVFVTLMLTNSLIKLNIISLMQDEMLKKKDEKHLCKLQNHLCHLKCECQIKRPYRPWSWYTISNMVNSKIQTNGS